MPTEREDSSAIESLVIEGGVKGEGPATNVGSSSAPVGKPIMIPDLNKKTMTKVGLDGAREEGPLKAGADGFAVCDFPTGTVSTEIPNLSLVEFPKKKEKKVKVVLKRPAAQKKRNSKKGGILYCSEDESDSGGGSGESEDARDAVPGAGGEAASSSAASATPAVIAAAGDADEAASSSAASATPAVIAAAGDPDAPKPESDLVYGQMFYKKGGAVGIRKRGKASDGKPHKQLFQFSDSKVRKNDLLEIGTACRRKLENGESTEDARAWVTEQLRAKAAAVG